MTGMLGIKKEMQEADTTENGIYGGEVGSWKFDS